MEDTLYKKVQDALDSVRPYLVADGGNVELVDVKDDGIVEVRLEGACGTCPMAQVTLRMGIERELKRQVPEIQEVISL
ncbi:MAG: NifU family protein [Calditrichaeota bacterium]|nr:NifU family protein [Actinomycetota bacterium]NOY61455.1 NifU family protein [Calditrichota bacterium]